jgi:hypothetical protein
MIPVVTIYMGCSCPFLYDQYWQISKVFNFAQLANEMAVLILKPVGKVGFNFRANIQRCRDNQEQINQEPISTDNSSYSVKIRRSEVNKSLVYGVTDRKQDCQKIINKVMTEN